MVSEAADCTPQLNLPQLLCCLWLCHNRSLTFICHHTSCTGKALCFRVKYSDFSGGGRSFDLRESGYEPVNAFTDALRFLSSVFSGLTEWRKESETSGLKDKSKPNLCLLSLSVHE